jgi:Arm DNA-binding domain
MVLTDTAIRETKPRQKAFKMFDRNGLFLLVNPGGSKLWRWRYRFDSKEKLMALGEYPLVNVEQARELHFAVRKTLAAGIDPMAERKAEAEAKQREAENSFKKIARKWWEWWANNKSPRHADTVLRRLEADVFPAYGHKLIDAIGAPDIRELMLAV